MATRTRETAPGREKGATSPSNSAQNGTTAQHKSSPNHPKRRVPAQNQDSAASEKHVPNYLKPTISSGNDAAKLQGKKPVSGDSAHNPTLTRRRSFDKPPSPSRTQKTRISPGPALRSHSFSSKTNATQKPITDRHSKVSKDAGKQSTLYARPVSSVKKNDTYAKKQGTGNNTATTKEQFICTPENSEKNDVLQLETQSNDPESPVIEPEIQSKDQQSPVAEAEDEIIQVENNIEKGAEDEIIQVENNIEKGAEDFVVVSVDQTESEIDKDVQAEIAESDTVSEPQDTTLEVKADEPEDTPQIEEACADHEEPEKHIMTEINNSKVDEIESDGPVPEVKEKDGEQTETASENKEEGGDGSEDAESKETNVQEAVEDEKEEAESTTTKKLEAQKKDSAVSNNVIEETASKLREQRKNKVKALAGAFETVISLQEPK